MKTFFFLVGGFIIIWATFTCAFSPDEPVVETSSSPVQSPVAIVDAAASEGLDLELIIPLLHEVKDAKELEERLNEPNGINNLDLNNDGVVDYINVTEYGSRNAYGYALTTFPENGEEQEIAKIELLREADDRVLTQVSGNEQIYGENQHYQNRSSGGGFFFFMWASSPHSYHRSPYGYGRYPSSYKYPKRRNLNSYRSYASGYSNNYWSKQSGKSGATRAYKPVSTGLTSPKANMTAKSGIRRSLSNPTQAQKSFRTREAKAVKSGGFGRNKTASRSSSSTSRSKTSSSSSSSRSTRNSSSRGFGGRGK